MNGDCVSSITCELIKHFLDDKAEAKKAARSEQTVQDAPQQSEAVQPQEVAQASTGQMKRQSSFETPPRKTRAASSPSQGQAVAVTPPSQQELLPSPGSSRQMVPVQQSMGRGKPVLYRLDYLFGKTPDKQASPACLVSRPGKERSRLQRREDRRQRRKPGLLLPSTSSGPREAEAGAKTSWRAIPGLRKKRAEVSAAGNGAAKQHLRRHYKVSHSFASRLAKPSEQERLADFVRMRSLGKTGLRQQGSHLGFAWVQWRRGRAAKPGKRMPKTPGAALGKTDRHRQVWTQTALWAQLQEAAGHQLSMADVLGDFEERPHKARSVRQTQADKGLASPEELKELAAWKQKQDSLANKPKQRAKFKIKLMSRCGLRQRSSQQVQQLTAEDEKARLQVAWRLWDALLEAAASPSRRQNGGQPGSPQSQQGAAKAEEGEEKSEAGRQQGHHTGERPGPRIRTAQRTSYADSM